MVTTLVKDDKIQHIQHSIIINMIERILHRVWLWEWPQTQKLYSHNIIT